MVDNLIATILVLDWIFVYTAFQLDNKHQILKLVLISSIFVSLPILGGQIVQLYTGGAYEVLAVTAFKWYTRMQYLFFVYLFAYLLVLVLSTMQKLPEWANKVFGKFNWV